MYYTYLAGLTISGAFVTFTHSLGFTPASIVCRPIAHSPLATLTVPLVIGTIGTNIVTVAAGPGTFQTFDLEVQFIHSIIS